MEIWVESDFGVLLWVKNLFHMAILLEYMLLGGEKNPWRKVVGHGWSYMRDYRLKPWKSSQTQGAEKPIQSKKKKGTTERHLPPPKKKTCFSKNGLRVSLDFQQTPPHQKKKRFSSIHREDFQTHPTLRPGHHRNVAKMFGIDTPVRRRRRRRGPSPSWRSPTTI